eukprot:232810-Chlamydomonas_euryale.AAC.4
MAAVVAQTAPAEVTAVAAATTAATRPAAAVTMAAMVAVAASAAAAAAGATATTAAAAPKGWLVVVQPAAHVSARPLRVPCWQKRSAMSPTTGCLVAAAARRPPALSTAARRLKRSCPAFAYSLRGNLSRRQAARQSRQLLPPLLLGLQLGLHMWWLMVVLAPLGVPMPGWRTQTVQAKRRRPCSQPIHRTGPAPAFASWILCTETASWLECEVWGVWGVGQGVRGRWQQQQRGLKLHGIGTRDGALIMDARSCDV